MGENKEDGVMEKRECKEDNENREKEKEDE